MQIHDTHAHLDYLLKQKPELVIDDLLKDHKFWIQPGVNLERDRYCLENYLKYDKMFFMIGAHPGEVVDQWDLEDYLIGQQCLIRDFENELGHKIIAIGEIGLDYRADTPLIIKEEQKLLLDIEIKLARELNLPFVIHCRDAWEDLFIILEANKPYTKTFLIHCYTSDQENYNRVVELGGYVAFGGIVTYPNTQKLNEAVLHANNYVIETDLPWLAPVPFRGQINTPENIQYIIEHIAKVKNITTEEVISTSLKNTQKIFGIDI
jgi:TatD DNase family protein